MCATQQRRRELEAAARAARAALRRDGIEASQATHDEFSLCYWECVARGRRDIWARAGREPAGKEGGEPS